MRLLANSAVSLAVVYLTRKNEDVFVPMFKSGYHLLLIRNGLPVRVFVTGISLDRPRIVPLKTTSGGQTAVREFDFLFVINVDTLSMWFIPVGDVPLRETVWIGEKYDRYRVYWNMPDLTQPSTEQKEKPQLYKDLRINQSIKTMEIVPEPEIEQLNVEDLFEQEN